MNVEVITGLLGEVNADAVVVGLSTDDKKLPAALAALDRRAEGRIAAVLAAEKFHGKAAAVTHLHVTESGGYQAVLQISEVDGRRYVDKSWRVS
jgi:ABC-type phosphate transport system auxiliary subunit